MNEESKVKSITPKREREREGGWGCVGMIGKRISKTIHVGSKRAEIILFSRTVCSIPLYPLMTCPVIFSFFFKVPLRRWQDLLKQAIGISIRYLVVYS